MLGFLFRLFKVFLLFLNALAVLHEDRFLRNYNLHYVNAVNQSYLQRKIAETLYYIRELRTVLMIVNFVMIFLIMF